MPSSVSSFAVPALIVTVLAARSYLRQRSARLKGLGAVPPGRKVVVLNLLDRNR